MSFFKGGMAMMSYFDAFGPHLAALRSESGTVGAIAGILKAPFDILADKLRGYKGLCMDMFRQPKKVLAACEALAPHLLQGRPDAAPIRTRTCRSGCGCTAAACPSFRPSSSRNTTGRR